RNKGSLSCCQRPRNPSSCSRVQPTSSFTSQRSSGDCEPNLRFFVGPGSTWVQPPIRANGATVERTSSRHHAGNRVSGCRVISLSRTLELPQHAVPRLIARESEKPTSRRASLIE